MENSVWRHPWTGWVPTPEEMQEHNGSIVSLPQVNEDGWNMIEYANGKTEVLHIRKVLRFGYPRLELYYSAENGPVYDDGYYAPRMRPITQEAALAWYAENGITPPPIRENGVRADEEAPVTQEQRKEEDLAAWEGRA